MLLNVKMIYATLPAFFNFKLLELRKC